MQSTSVGPAVFSLMTLLGIAAIIYLAARRFRLQFSTTLVFVGLPADNRLLGCRAV